MPHIIDMTTADSDIFRLHFKPLSQ